MIYKTNNYIVLLHYYKLSTCYISTWKIENNWSYKNMKMNSYQSLNNIFCFLMSVTK